MDRPSSSASQHEDAVGSNPSGAGSPSDGIINNRLSSEPPKHISGPELENPSQISGPELEKPSQDLETVEEKPSLELAEERASLSPLAQDASSASTEEVTKPAEQQSSLDVASNCAQHEHSDSLVTVRLSEPSKANVPEVPGDTTEVATQRPGEATPVQSSDPEPPNSRASDLKTSDELPCTESGNRESSSIKDDAPADETDRPSNKTPRSSASTIDPTNVSKLDEQSQRSSMSSAAKSESIHSRDSDSSPPDWAELEKNEELEERDGGTDESTAFLLARLEKENNAIATDPKAGMGKSRCRSGSRPPSMQQLKRMVSEPQKSPLRYSLLPNPPPMTELEFWSALVRDYPQTAQRLPTLTSNKIRNGVPPPLRGVVWASIAGARDAKLEDEYEKLSSETSPHEKAIHKDVGRSYPGVDMFREADGEGQKMLSKVLSAFSLFDQEIGYCQGLGFVVGPLLMHMGDKEAFCVLVRLMDNYDLRSCFLPDLCGLHLRVYQFQHLLKQHLPNLTTHLETLKVEPLYLSQWFLSFFGVTCPLPMLIRIYDVILTEGASETLMRVALSLMRRNEEKLLASSEFEEIMQFLLGRSVWDTYNCNADDLVKDFCTWTGLVTREGLQSLETKFKESQQAATTPTLHSAASRFLGRFWTGTATTASPKPTSPSLAAPTQGTSDIRRTNSKQSMASTLNSIESSESASTATTAATEVSATSRQASADWVSVKQGSTSTVSVTASRSMAPNKDKDLHGQIEDLLMALGNMQREHSVLASELQREREEREEDRAMVQKVLDKLRKRVSLSMIPEDNDADQALEIKPSAPTTPASPDLDGAIADLETHFAPTNKRSSLVLQTKHQLRDEAQRWKAQSAEEAARGRELARQLTEREAENQSLKDELREARTRIADAYREQQRRDKIHRDTRHRGTLVAQRGSSLIDLSIDTAGVAPASAESPSSATPVSSGSANGGGGLRELKLGRRTSSTPAAPPPAFGKRMSSLSTQSVLATEDHRPAGEDALLLELVAAKTAEAVARQELEEVKGKLDALRKVLGGSAASPSGGGGGGHAASASLSEARRPTPPSPGPKAAAAAKPAEGDEKEKPAASTASTIVGGGFFSGWGKRAVSGMGS